MDGINSFNCPDDSNAENYVLAEKYEYSDDFIDRAAEVQKHNSLSISDNDSI